MGLATEDVLDTGAAAIAEEFKCAVCTYVIPYRGAVATPCGHAFCRVCLQKWMERSSSCPCCQKAFCASDARPLEDVQPLAFRALGSLRVRCPLSSSSIRCTWKGDYSELHAHMLLGCGHAAKKNRKGNDSEVCAHASGDAQRANASSSAQSQDTPAVSTAEVFKEQGNARFGEGQFLEAIQLYSRAVALEPSNPRYLNNRAAAFLHCGAYSEAATDCRRALKLDSTNAKALNRLGKSLMFTTGSAKAVEHFDAALQLLRERSDRVKPADVASVQAEAERARTIAGVLETCNQALARGDAEVAHRALVAQIDLLRQYRTSEIQLLFARVSVAMGDIDEALRITRELVKQDKGHVDALVVRAAALYQCNGAVEANSALQHVKEALRLDPDHAHGRVLFKHIRRVHHAMEHSQKMVSQRAFDEAVTTLSEILAHAEAQLRGSTRDTDDSGPLDTDADASSSASSSPTPYPLHHRSQLAVDLFEKRAAAYFRLKEYEACLADCAKALYSTEASVSASVLQAKALMALGRHEQAAQGLRGLLEVDPHNTQLRAQYEKVVFEKRKLARPDYYAILGLEGKGRVASAMEVRAAYKVKAMELHPDRQPPEKRAEAEVRFKELQEALEILSDDMKRDLYNDGYDKEAIQERVEAAHRAAHKTGSHHH